MRESDIENYFIKMVWDAGGDTRKLKYIERKGAPDRLVLFPFRHFLVELKAPGKKADLIQRKEHKRLKEAGFDVYVIDSYEGVDSFVAWATR